MEIERRETGVPTVLVAGSDACEDWVAGELGDGAEVEAISDAAAVGELAAADAVDCAVVAPTDESNEPPLPEAAREAIESIREAAPDIPVVYAPAEADGVAASQATAAGASEYLPRAVADEGDLADRVDRLVVEFDCRRQATIEQGMFRELLGNAPFSIYFKDREGRHVAVTSHTTGSFDQTFVGKTDVELYADEVGEDLARESLEDDLAVVETGDPVVDREECHVTPEGEEIWLRTTKFPWRDEDGEIVGVVGMTRDVSEVKHRELELEQEKRRLEQFASFASHDLRNPVSIAQGYLERAMAGEGDVEDAHEAVAESLDRMDQLIDDLLNMASPEDERDVDGWVDLAAVADRAWTVADTEDAALVLDVPKGFELRGAQGALRQLFENLFSNAVQHGSTSPPSTSSQEDADERSSSSPGSQARQDAAGASSGEPSLASAREDAVEHGGRTVTVEVGLTEEGFYVQDDGPGIPEEHRETVFEYGYTTGGTGVGLAITREIAEAHGWTPRATASGLRTNGEGSESTGARFELEGVIRRPPPLEEVPLAEPVALDTTTDVDGAMPPGDVERVAEGAWTLQGGGDNLWGDLDEYFALHGAASGDLRIEARLTDLERIHEYSKGGVLVADAVAAGSPLCVAGVTAAHGAETTWRTAPGETIDTEQFDAVGGVPAYVRIDRLGDRLTCYVSVDGTEWEPIDQRVVAVDDPVQVGLAVCSHNVERRCEAVFEAVRVVELRPRDETGE